MIHHNTKIIATVGPACSSYQNLLALAQEGVAIFRINFSHGTYDDHAAVIHSILQINEKHDAHLGILCDLQGPKLRIGLIENNQLEVFPGDILTFVNESCIGTKDKIYMSYENFAEDVKPGESILIDDGKLVFEVIESNKKDTVKLKCLFGGILSSNKGVNLPDTEISLPSLTPKDMRDLEFILQHPVNWIALSFVRKARDIEELINLIENAKHSAKVIAKIEKPEAIKNLDAIIKISNGIMIARGDLGVEFPIEKLPTVQKMIIAKCIQRARPVIVATQLMDSMIQNPSPTRAEVTDVANAVLDGTDAVMLSAETSVGMHPVKVVKAMNKIIFEAEKHYAIITKRPRPSDKSSTFISDVVCFNAAKTAEDIKAKAIIGLTVSGYTAFKTSSYRPNCPIFIFSSAIHMLGTLNLVWGVRCYYYDKMSSTDETIDDLIELLKAEKKLQVGDLVVNTGSMPIHKKLRTNMLKVTEVE
ncbi:MAG: pyruvate kinase [Saprospiraceae bacterium]|nr:pyruvate kinase [Saprospiraceae bacterium]MBK8450861.1 pyruvate kinase [Saprospiraceae bacterium]MBK8485060.1 pyruvate kinase [Saprospiraceae bacterium]MBK9223137.1 pyruvate kinase [Saprospiraceae bacterium]MBK9720667.1 pyruvate kinase [Saprospiraceae bacterium]